MRRLLSCLFKIEKEIAAINQKTILDSVLMPFSNCSGLFRNCQTYKETGQKETEQGVPAT